MVRKVIKALKILSMSPHSAKAMIHGAALAIEHLPALKQIEPKLLIDVGANKGQFSLATAHLYPEVKVLAFEPLVKQSAILKRVLNRKNLITVEECALSKNKTTQTFFVSERADSSSLLPIGSLQSEYFKGTSLSHEIAVRVKVLDDYTDIIKSYRPNLLKLDVQEQNSTLFWALSKHCNILTTYMLRYRLKPSTKVNRWQGSLYLA